jgi:3-phenylpropionate/cinnamic acid dioxygenase small subunit
MVAQAAAVLTDADQIRNNISRFSKALDERRFADWAATFTEDGSFGDRKGRAAIQGGIENGELAKNPALQRKHAVMNTVITFTGADTAHAESDLVMFDSRNGERWYTAGIGKYHDDLQRQPNGEWLFTLRILEWGLRER